MEIQAWEGAAVFSSMMADQYDQMSLWGQTGATFEPSRAIKMRDKKIEVTSPKITMPIMTS
jgi:hypothetical protein